METALLFKDGLGGFQGQEAQDAQGPWVQDTLSEIAQDNINIGQTMEDQNPSNKDEDHEAVVAFCDPGHDGFAQFDGITRPTPSAVLDIDTKNWVPSKIPPHDGVFNCKEIDLLLVSTDCHLCFNDPVYLSSKSVRECKFSLAKSHIPTIKSSWLSRYQLQKPSAFNKFRKKKLASGVVERAKTVSNTSGGFVKCIVAEFFFGWKVDYRLEGIDSGKFPVHPIVMEIWENRRAKSVRPLKRKSNDSDHPNKNLKQIKPEPELERSRVSEPSHKNEVGRRLVETCELGTQGSTLGLVPEPQIGVEPSDGTCQVVRLDIEDDDKGLGWLDTPKKIQPWDKGKNTLQQESSRPQRTLFTSFQSSPLTNLPGFARTKGTKQSAGEEQFGPTMRVVKEQLTPKIIELILNSGLRFDNGDGERAMHERKENAIKLSELKHELDDKSEECNRLRQQLDAEKRRSASIIEKSKAKVDQYRDKIDRLEKSLGSLTGVDVVTKETLLHDQVELLKESHDQARREIFLLVELIKRMKDREATKEGGGKTKINASQKLEDTTVDMKVLNFHLNNSLWPTEQVPRYLDATDDEAWSVLQDIIPGFDSQMPQVASFVRDRVQCSLCFDPFGPEGAMVLGGCNHPWHPACLYHYSSIKKECWCRAEIHDRYYIATGRRDLQIPRPIVSPNDMTEGLADIDLGGPFNIETLPTNPDHLPETQMAALLASGQLEEYMQRWNTSRPSPDEQRRARDERARRRELLQTSAEQNQIHEDVQRTDAIFPDTQAMRDASP